jgi:hypothetical protein
MVYQSMPTSGGACEGVLSCLTADLVAVAAGAAVFLALFAAAALANVVAARESAEDERERLRAEADALGRFAAQVAELDTGGAGGAVAANPGATTVAGSTGHRELHRVREAYRTTVMAVPHYDEEYGESLERNLRVEFGDDVAAAVVDGTGFTPQLRDTLVSRGREARRRRLLVVDHIDEEVASLDAAKKRLEPVADSVERIEDAPLSSFDRDELAAERYLLADREADCEAVVEERQRTVQERKGLTDRVDAIDSIEQYLYGPLSAGHPVLADATALLGRVQDLQRRVTTAMGER